MGKRGSRFSGWGGGGAGVGAGRLARRELCLYFARARARTRARTRARIAQVTCLHKLPVKIAVKRCYRCVYTCSFKLCTSGAKQVF